MSALARILIVEDDPNDLELTLTALGEYNLANEVIVTRDGQEALDWIVIWTRVEFPATIEPECLVLDVRLPGLSGLELQKRMAKVDLDIPIVFITGHGDIPNSCVSSKSESSSASAALGRSAWMFGWSPPQMSTWPRWIAEKRFRNDLYYRRA